MDEEDAVSDRLRRVRAVNKDPEGGNATALFCREEAARRRAWLGLDGQAEAEKPLSGSQRARH